MPAIHIPPDDCVIDPNLLAHPDTRRLILAAWSWMGDTMVMVPSTANELKSLLADDQERTWRKRWDRLPAEEQPEDRGAACRALAKAAADWVAEEAELGGSGEGAFTVVPMDPKDADIIESIASNIPDYCFKKPLDSNAPERKAVAEVLFTGHTLLVDRQSTPLRIRALNRWAHSMRPPIPTVPVIDVEDGLDAAFAYCDLNVRTTLIKAALGCCPDGDRDSVETVREWLLDFAGKLGEAGFPDLKFDINHQLVTRQNEAFEFKHFVDEHQAMNHEAERRLEERTEMELASVGWEPPSNGRGPTP